MSEKNADEILSIENVNGGLIGGASLKGDSFCSIIQTAEKYII
ncbi:MAG: triose-phosphate isomerase [Bacteroidota bacterium]